VKILAQPGDAGKRLDVLLRERLPDHTRSRIQDWIKRDQVLVDGAVQRASYVIRGTEEIDATPVPSLPLKAMAEDIAIDILYEDEDLVAINKAAGMVVHAGAGVYAGTVVNALLHRFQTLSSVGGEMRPGIVHRLDRFTSGVLLVAKTDAAHQNLSAQFADRKVRKVYLTMVHGRIATQRLRIDKPITRDPNRRERMTTRLGEGRAGGRTGAGDNVVGVVLAALFARLPGLGFDQVRSMQRVRDRGSLPTTRVVQNLSPEKPTTIDHQPSAISPERLQTLSRTA